MLSFVTLNPIQDEMVNAFEELRESAKELQKIDWEAWEHKERFKELSPRRDELFKELTEKRTATREVVANNPALAADLIERLMDLAYKYRDQ